MSANTPERPIVVGGDGAVWFGELDEPRTEGQRRLRALKPDLVWLTHLHEPWRPGVAQGLSSASSLTTGAAASLTDRW